MAYMSSRMYCMQCMACTKRAVLLILKELLLLCSFIQRLLNIKWVLIFEVRRCCSLRRNIIWNIMSHVPNVYLIAILLE